MLKRLRGDMSLRGVQRLSGISNAYLSQIEKGLRHPGPKLLRRLAALYGVGVEELFRKAGYLESDRRGAGGGRGDGGGEGLPVRSLRPGVPRGNQTQGAPLRRVEALHRRVVRAIQRKEAPVVSGAKLDGFCHGLMNGGIPRGRLHPAEIAREFVDFLGLSAFPDMDEISALLEEGRSCDGRPLP